MTAAPSALTAPIPARFAARSLAQHVPVLVLRHAARFADAAPRGLASFGRHSRAGLATGRASRLVTAAKTEYERIEGSLSAQGLGFAIVRARR